MKIELQDATPADVCPARVPTACPARHAVALEEEVTGLFEQLRNPLFRYLLSLGLSAQDGEEMIQEVFLALFQHLKNGKPRDNLRGWIFRVGHNQALKVRQRHGAQPAHRRRATPSMEVRIRSSRRSTTRGSGGCRR